MVYFQDIDLKKFLTEYWQKKPLVIRQALPGFINHISGDELAGLAMEEVVESRIVWETPNKNPAWHLKRGPFAEEEFQKLPKTHWTLLVQGVDRFVPEIADLFNRFNFIPQWRIDDVMISYAARHGSVGPHYDNYDVFLYQAAGRRKWGLTSRACHPQNFLANCDLRIMKQFEIEEEYILEEGDMLYLPPHIGHYGIALADECMTYSFGYRSYQGQEMWDTFGDHLSENNTTPLLYQDPDWNGLTSQGEIPREAWLNARKLMLQMLDDESQLKSWFGCFVTRLDGQGEELLPEPLSAEEFVDLAALETPALFISALLKSKGLLRNEICRFAYTVCDDTMEFFINGDKWNTYNVSNNLLIKIATCCSIKVETLLPFINNSADQYFLFELWKLRWLEIME